MLAHFLFDSAFANGAYSHSFGLESYINWGEVRSFKTFTEWLHCYMQDIFATNDGLIYELATAFKKQPLSLLKLARASNAAILSAEARQANINIARASLKNTEFMHDAMAAWYKSVCEREDFCSAALAMALLAPNEPQAFAYAAIKTLTQNATRTIPLSYKDASRLLYENIKLASLAASKAQSLARPMIAQGFFDARKINFSSHTELELAQFAHESLDFRLFMS